MLCLCFLLLLLVLRCSVQELSQQRVTELPGNISRCKSRRVGHNAVDILISLQMIGAFNPLSAAACSALLPFVPMWLMKGVTS